MWSYEHICRCCDMALAGMDYSYWLLATMQQTINIHSIYILSEFHKPGNGSLCFLDGWEWGPSHQKHTESLAQASIAFYNQGNQLGRTQPTNGAATWYLDPVFNNIIVLFGYRHLSLTAGILMKRQPDLWTMILTRINGVRSIKSHLIKIMSIAIKHSCSKLRDPVIATSSYLITRRAPALP